MTLDYTMQPLRSPARESTSTLKRDKHGHLRILIVGNSGTGKSTMADKLSTILHFPTIHLDRMYWQPNWTETPDAEFREKVQAFVRANDNWIIDGNYKRLMDDITFAHATCILWLDPPFALYFPRLLLRTLLRLTRLHPPCSPGCPEHLTGVLSRSKSSILWWAWTNHTPQHESCTARMQQPGDDRGGKWVRLGGWGGEVAACLREAESSTRAR